MGERSQRKIMELEAENAKWIKTIDHLILERKTLESENVKLVERIDKLKDYTGHNENCSVCFSPTKQIVGCDCGLDDVLFGEQNIIITWNTKT